MKTICHNKFGFKPNAEGNIELEGEIKFSTKPLGYAEFVFKGRRVKHSGKIKGGVFGTQLGDYRFIKLERSIL